jgi:hypothetical protein
VNFVNVEVNILTIIIAAVVAMAVGFLWYSPMLFGKQWMMLMGYTAESMEKAKKSMGKMYAISFVLSLVTAYVLSHVMTLSENFFNYGMLETGVMTAFWMWLGFVMPVQATDALFGGKRKKLVAINTGYQLASLVVMGIVLAVL